MAMFLCRRAANWSLVLIRIQPIVRGRENRFARFLVAKQRKTVNFTNYFSPSHRLNIADNQQAEFVIEQLNLDLEDVMAIEKQNDDGVCDKNKIEFFRIFLKKICFVVGMGVGERICIEY